jgi:hypothetical protein
MSSTHSYDGESFLDEFFPDPDERADVEAGARQLVNRSTDQDGVHPRGCSQIGAEATSRLRNA